MTTPALVFARSPIVLARPLAVWAVVLLSGLLVLYGRYDWSDNVRSFALRGYVTSGYIFLFFVPTLYYTLRALGRRPHTARVGTGVAFLLLTLPYRWLGLDRYAYYVQHPQWYTIGAPGVPPPATEWFPDGLAKLPAIPHEGLLFGLLFLAGGAVATLCWQGGPRPLALPANRAILALLAVYSLILAQTWLHLSLRSPYTYVPHFEQPPQAGYWYHVYMFPDGQGAVNADQFVFATLEDYFTGAPRDGNNLLISRSFMFYLAAQVSYFVNSFYVFLVLNVLAWLAAVRCGYLFTRRVWNERVAGLTAAMIACGPGFIMYVGQTSNYLFGNAAIIIMLYLFQAVLADGACARGAYVLFGALLGLASMTYDIFPLYALFLGYGFVRGLRMPRLIASLALALAIYSGFLLVHSEVLRIPTTPINLAQASAVRDTIMNRVLHPTLDSWYIVLINLFGRYWGHLGKAFFLLPLLPALAGVALLRNRVEIVLIACLFAMSLGLIGVLQLGNLWLAVLPRFVYISYPGVYILASLALDRLASTEGAPWSRGLLRAAPWAFIAALFVLNNIDVFGFPSLYYHFYWEREGGFAWNTAPYPHNMP